MLLRLYVNQQVFLVTLIIKSSKNAVPRIPLRINDLFQTLTIVRRNICPVGKSCNDVSVTRYVSFCYLQTMKFCANFYFFTDATNVCTLCLLICSILDFVHFLHCRISKNTFSSIILNRTSLKPRTVHEFQGNTVDKLSRNSGTNSIA